MANTTNIGLETLGTESMLRDFPRLFNYDLDIIDSVVGTVQQNQYPISVGQEVTEAANFNTFLTPGIFTFRLSATVASSGNRPCDFAGKLLVWTLDGNPMTSGTYKYGHQIYQSIEGQEYHRKMLRDGIGDLTFSGWSPSAEPAIANVFSDGNLNDITSASTLYASNTTLNCPAPWSIVKTYVQSDGTMSQICMCCTDPLVYYRHKASNTWKPWVLFKKTDPTHTQLVMNNTVFHGMYSAAWNRFTIEVHDVATYYLTSIQVYANNTWVSLTDLTFANYNDFKQLLTGVPPANTLTDGKCYMCSVTGVLFR